MRIQGHTGQLSHYTAQSRCSLFMARLASQQGSAPAELSHAGAVGGTHRVPSGFAASPPECPRENRGPLERLQLEPSPPIRPLTHGLAHAVEKQTLACLLCEWGLPLPVSFFQVGRVCTSQVQHRCPLCTHAHTHTVAPPPPHPPRDPVGPKGLLFHRDF